MAGIVDAYTSLIAKIKSINITNNANQQQPFFCHIWNNQFDGEVDDDGNKKYSIPLPAALIEILNPQPRADIGLGITAGDITFRIHIGMEQLDAGDGTMEQNLAIFTLRDALITLLTDFMPTACSEMQLISEEQDYSHTNFYHYILDFRTHFIDSKGDQTTTQQAYGPPVTLDIVAGFNPLEILSVVYDNGAQTLAINYRLLAAQDVKFIVDGGAPFDAGTQPISESATFVISSISLSSGAHTLVANAVASNYSTIAWNFTV
jgi:hypothetical protein